MRVAAAIIGILVAACSDEQANTLVFAECAIEGATEKALCGHLDVPENWDDPDGRKIALNVVVIPSIEKTKAAPLFDLAGGPGIAATGGALFYLTDGAAYRQKRDIVLADQRGTGDSAPLRCPELESQSPLARMYQPDKVAACRRTLEAAHDLTKFGTLDAVRDLEAVRRALGHEAVDIFAMSYGTKLAQAYMRAFPESVRSAVFVGSAPIGMKTPLDHAANAESVLRLIFADCAADAACRAAYPDIEGDWRKLVARFDAGPVAAETPDGPIRIERGPFMEAFRATMTLSSGQREAPRLISAAANGDLGPFVDAIGSGAGPGIAEGLYLSIACAEGAARIDPGEIDAATADTFLGRYRIDEQLGACALWPVANVPADFFEPVQSDAPTLFISGGRDHATPREGAASIAHNFSNGRIVVIEEMGHIPAAESNIGCFDEMALAFYASADPAAVDASCVAKIRAPAFSLAKAK